MSLFPLNAMHRPAILFAGQATPWQSSLADAAQTHHAQTRLSGLLAEARGLVAARARQLASVVPGAAQRLETLVGVNGSDHIAPEIIDAHPAVSVPGIVLSQIGATDHLRALGLGFDDAILLGHSQGSLGVAATREPERALAFALLLGGAASHLHGTSEARSQMVSIRGMRSAVVEKLIEGLDAEIAVLNSPNHVVLSGAPSALSTARQIIEAAAESANRDIENALRGGSAMEIVVDELDVAFPFHHSSNQAVADLAVAWAQECGLELRHADIRELAQAILVEPANWVAELAKLSEEKATHALTLDNSLERLSAKLLGGTGVALVPADTSAHRDALATPGTEMPKGTDYSKYAPRLITLPDGRRYTQTHFSRVTGLSPIILGGMTPTTADADIVAAAANAGYWTELAGGGMYSDEVFSGHRKRLEQLLNPGRTVQFNTMFFDRSLWNLHFGQTRLVPKARAAGAPFNGVCISAGIPEPEESTELLEQLREEGFPYIAFKPGTSQQIRQTLKIAQRNPDFTIILMVEDGHAGGHHSWIDLDDMLVETYAETREHDNVLLTVGGGIHSPERAADLLTGTWSEPYGLPAMPVDGVFVGTVAMAAKESNATESVKDALVATKGVSLDHNGGWVSRGTGSNGAASSQSHLLADIHEIDNSFAAASRFITSLKIEEYAEHREEIIEILSKTSKPYFGDVETMTYAEWLNRFVELAHPFTDSSWDDRFFDLLHRIEARLNPADRGEIDTLFSDVAEVADAPAAVERLLSAYPAAHETTVSPRDAAWWIALQRKHSKPMPWVPALDGDLKVWFGKDTLWQAQHERYTADQVRIIPGPVAVAGITKKNEPVADILARFEQGTTDRLVAAGAEEEKLFSRLGDATVAEEFIKAAPTLSWHGHLMANPAYEMDDAAYDLVRDEDGNYSIRINADSYWDDLPEDSRPFYVREVTIPLDLPESIATGASPVVSDERLPDAVFALLEGLAGVGSVSETGDKITEMPKLDENGVVHYSFTLPASLLNAHTSTTGSALGTVTAGTPDVLVGPCWPAIYTALGSGKLADGYPVIEGLLNAVHLNHVIDLRVPLSELADGRTIDVTGRCTGVSESSSGRIVTVELELFSEGEVVATQMQRFAIRGRAQGTDVPAPAPEYGGGKSSAKVESTPRSFVERAVVTAPEDMTPFALVSGDYNPIHTSTNAAQLVNLQAPLVHGMWLSATAQHLAGRHGRVVGWTYSMYGMVQLNDEVEITVERVGRKGLHAAFEVTCRIDGEVVSVGQALMAQPRTAYIFPGQGIQTEGMGAGDRSASAAARDAWRRADRHTRSAHGFSIQHIVDENPVELQIRGTMFKHPQGVLHLTQFTQVALAVVAYAQTERLREADALASNSFYAGHSLGEYTALASLANIFDLEAIIDVVYSRGTAMGSLVERDAHGNSNYGMGALRPNMIGVAPKDVKDYVAGIAEETGEFLEIVNFNIEGQQYSIAGTRKGLKVLEERANAVRERAYVTVPGIDVPFHSRILRPGVAEFAKKLDELLPRELNLDVLVGRYIPNLVARPFELSDDFIEAIREVAPSEALEGKKVADFASESELARVLVIELLSWQFASPVRWIETQKVLFNEVDQLIEVGLASSPTLTNLAKRQMAIDGVDLPIFNVERDQDVVMLADVKAAPVVEEPTEESESAVTPAAHESAPAAAPAQAEPVAAPTASAPAASGASSADAPELPFTAAEAIMVLFAYANKIRVDQVTDSDTVEELTNGVSSRRNQLLMDMSAEIGVPAIDGAADADVATLRERVRVASPGYAPFGSVLSEALTSRLRTLFGSAGRKPAYVGEYVTGTWSLPSSWVAHVEAEILLGSREEDSVRGGSLTTVATSAASKADVDALIDAAVEAVAKQHGVSVSKSQAGGAAAGGVVDSAALTAYAESVTGENGVLATAARTILDQLGLTLEPVESEPVDNSLFETVEAELGSGWVDLVSPSFDANKAVLFDDRFAYAREDLARVALGEKELEASRFLGDGDVVARQAAWWADNGAVNPDLMREISQAASTKCEGEYAKDIALVTGAAPGSIATALVERLLAGGATVIMTASRVSQSRKEFARQLFAEHGVPGSALWLVPTNLSSYRDVDALIDWIGTEQVETVGNEVKVMKKALTPTLAFPFAAPSVSGALADAGPAAENQTRLLLWSLERTIAGLSALAQKGIDTRTHIVLPGSPNRGMFGGDGAYAEVKSALDAILAKWSSEAGWPEGVTLAQAKIGWVAGTHLMGGNDGLVPAAKAAGIHVWSPEEISTELMKLVSAESRARAATAPIESDLTGGLGSSAISITELAQQVQEQAQTSEGSAPVPASIRALPNTPNPSQVGSIEVGDVTADLDDMVVLVGVGEVSSWGSGRTRFEAEYGIQRSGDVDLTAAGVLELAWMTGLVHWSNDPKPSWYDADGNPVEEEDIYDRFRDEVVARAGVRELTDKFRLVDRGSIDLTEVFLDRDISFTVATEAEARDIEAADPEKTQVAEIDGEWHVTRLAGATARVPRKATLTRTVAGQMPDNFDPTKWGIPEHMVDSLDRMAVWNLVTAVDAFVNAGFSPAELLKSIHPLDVATTQGTGIGGMESLHKVFVTRFLGEDRQSDILQEALPNVVAAHTMQSLVGGYGSMIHPIGACATTAVSIEEAADKIKLGKADFVIAGGIDDVQVESLQGFGDMNATAETAKMKAKGIHDRFISRANDRRRGGFLEAEGGGTILLARGSVAADLGLPVHAVLVHAATYGDGAHTSIPAPGIGVLGAARGRENSRLARSLKSLGLTPNDVSVLSKHDTSTNANDPNEAELHSLLWPAVGRDKDKPMFVISQKTLTGHSKAGAALFQTGGLIDVLRTGVLPPNASLDTVDPLIEPVSDSLVWLREPINLGEVKAAALTSLGFGHVGALVVYAHPGVFEAALKAAGRDAGEWRAQATRRLRAGAAHMQAGMMGRVALFEPISGRRLPEQGAHAAEINLLLNEDVRLGEDGLFPQA